MHGQGKTHMAKVPARGVAIQDSVEVQQVDLNLKVQYLHSLTIVHSWMPKANARKFYTVSTLAQTLKVQ